MTPVRALAVGALLGAAVLLEAVFVNAGPVLWIVRPGHGVHLGDALATLAAATVWLRVVRRGGAKNRP